MTTQNMGRIGCVGLGWFAGLLFGVLISAGHPDLSWVETGATLVGTLASLVLFDIIDRPAPTAKKKEN